MGTLTTVNKELGGSISLHISHISLHTSQSSFSPNMLRQVSLLAVASLAHSSPLSQDVSLPAGCKDYTVGECNPEADELIDTYNQIPDGAVCQTLCGIQEGCNYFRHSKANLTCTLYHYRFLTSCNLIAGPVTPTIDECTVDEEHSCDSFIRENCEYQGDKVLEKGSITDQHACQDLLAEMEIFMVLSTSCSTMTTRTVFCIHQRTWSVMPSAYPRILPWTPAMVLSPPKPPLLLQSINVPVLIK